MSTCIRIERGESPPPPVRLVEFVPGRSTGGPGVRIEFEHADVFGSSMFSVTFTDDRREWGRRWSDHHRSDIVALRDALTQLLNDNP